MIVEISSTQIFVRLDCSAILERHEGPADAFIEVHGKFSLGIKVKAVAFAIKFSRDVPKLHENWPSHPVALTLRTSWNCTGEMLVKKPPRS